MAITIVGKPKVPSHTDVQRALNLLFDCKSTRSAFSFSAEEEACMNKAHLNTALTTPSKDPGSIYKLTLSLSGGYDLFRLQQPNGQEITPDRRQKALDAAREYHERLRDRSIGYQINTSNTFLQQSHYLDHHLNNVGDPFVDGSCNVNSKFMERAVLDYFAALWRAKWPHNMNDPESYWGFCLSIGGTEGNMYASWNARDYLAGKMIVTERNSSRTRSLQACNLPRNSGIPICFFSEDTHYSLIKVMRVLNFRTCHDEGTENYPDECPLGPGAPWPDGVPSNPDGTINIDSLAKLVNFFGSRGHPIFVNFNLGTTYKGAHDDVEAAGRALMPILKKYNLYERTLVWVDDNKIESHVVRTGFWFHVDGCLGAAYMPFLEMAYDAGLTPQRGPNFDFRLDFMHSIAVSGHKWIGAPMPCGVYISKTKYKLNPPSNPAYIDGPDTTLAGSRSGLAVVCMWDVFSQSLFTSQITKILNNLAMAQYMEDSLRQVERRLGIDLYISRSHLSLTVLFRRPVDELVLKYTLSKASMKVDGEERLFCHIYAMNHVTYSLVDEFMQELVTLGYPDDLHSVKSLPPPPTPCTSLMASVETMAKVSHDQPKKARTSTETPASQFSRPTPCQLIVVP